MSADAGAHHVSPRAGPSIPAGGGAAIGVVVIGRNEGARLPAALHSARASGCPVVYVDSASTDGSSEGAAALGFPVVALNPATRTTAAMARNAGFLALRGAHPTLNFVQFLDGDSELAPGWIEAAGLFLGASPGAGVVCGRLREKNRDGSLYRRLMDMEWHREAGQVSSCGGIFMARAAAFEESGMFDGDVAVGEEADLCVRLRARGWTVHRIDVAMGSHDSGIDGFGAWWRRCARGGSGYADGVLRYRSRDGGANVRRLASCLVWGLALPLLLLGALVATAWWSRSALLAAALLGALVCLQVARTALRQRRRLSTGDALRYATFCMIAKVPEGLGAAARLARARAREAVAR